ncbi:MAG TPA: hypothetical protein VGR72_06260 [Candidatus Acidoferrales bacterium]|nr:hypothetical protein [Candidatus Acidoferrales bacterium]HEV3481151.1 hypothetical protein [Candidatus Acidoferrales bacterium]
MKRFTSGNWLTVGMVSLVLAMAVSAQGNGKTNPDAKPTIATIEGLVRDISCAIQDKQSTATDFNIKCALQCARNGSPLIILSKDGVIYTPISDATPDKDVRQPLMPFVGKYVNVTGQVFERTGTHAIAINQITEMKNVRLVTDQR